LYWRQRQERN